MRAGQRSVNIFDPVVWVCGNASCFNDDVETLCQDCDVKIFHRPHAITTAAKLCLPCAEIRRGLEHQKGAVVMTRQCIEDAERFFK